MHDKKETPVGAGVKLEENRPPDYQAREDGTVLTTRSQHERDNEEIFRADHTVQDILVRYSVQKGGCFYLKTRNHGLIQLVDISDAIWDEAMRRREAGVKR